MAPEIFVHSAMMQTVLVYGFAAAVIGGLESFVGAVVGGLIIGLGENAASRTDIIGEDLKTVTMLAVLVLTLTVRPRGLFGSAAQRSV